MSRESYESLPYPQLVFPETHPRWLETVATAYGLTPPPIETCRVLELGCATGGNLVPMAVSLPRAKFVGIDYSPKQIEQAQQFSDGVGASNLSLQTLSIMDITPEFGKFDYIITHGVYSWVPPDVQEKILAICRENLSEHGIAYVSFNTFPGWHVRLWLRDMMLFHAPASEGQNPLARMRRVGEFFETLRESPVFGKSKLGEVLDGHFKAAMESHPAYVTHEYMEDMNQPIYIRDFIASAAKHGLQYVADATLNGSYLEDTVPRIREVLDGLGDDFIRREQYLDFIRDTPFRRALLTQKGRNVLRSGFHARIGEFYVASCLNPDIAPEKLGAAILTGETIPFGNPNEFRLRVSFPLSKAVMAALKVRWPEACRISDILDEAADAIHLPQEERAAARRETTAELLRAWMLRLIMFYKSPPRIGLEVPERPEVWKVSRHQAANGVKEVVCTRHELTTFSDPGVVQTLPYFDGTRTVPQLATALRSAGLINTANTDPPGSAADVAVVDGMIDQWITRALLAPPPQR